jgi:hypothetical protein
MSQFMSKPSLMCVLNNKNNIDLANTDKLSNQDREYETDTENSCPAPMKKLSTVHRIKMLLLD